MNIYKIIIVIFLLCLDIIDIICRIITYNEKGKKDINTNTNPYYSKDLNGKLLFMRHGQTPFNAAKGNPSRRVNPIYIDSGLAKNGINQAKSKQNILNSLSLEKVYVSPFYRALQTLIYSLQNHPNKNNIIALVHPLVSEITNCVNDYILDIKKTKKDFNLNSIIKIDWSLFDEYIKGIKYDQNFYYFDNFDSFNEKEKNKIYLKLKNYYDKGNINKLKKGLAELAKLRFIKKKRFESLMHAQGRFKKFVDYIKIKHKKTMKNKDDKILVFSHGSFMRVATNMTPYESKIIQNFHTNCYAPKNCEILSYKVK